MGRHYGYAYDHEIQYTERRSAKGSLVQYETVRYGLEHYFDGEYRRKKVVEIRQNLRVEWKKNLFLKINPES